MARLHFLFSILLFLLLAKESNSEATSPPLSGAGMTMGGSGVGGVTWFFASEIVHSSEGCKAEADLESVEKFLTEVGERPGAKSGLTSAGIENPQKNVNLCILRHTGWVFRLGDVELVWIPDQTMTRVRGKEDVNQDELNIKTEL